MQDVGEQQLLVLLLMLQAQLQQGRGAGPAVGIGLLDQAQHGRIHMGAVDAHLVQRRAAQQAALGPRVARAQGLVIGVEEVEEALVKGLVARQQGRSSRASKNQLVCA